uniref:AAA+ ATPase domain-containing protein n=1 Tax=Sphaeramia orbicularis TaxID=375764 RepID=A0A673BFN6_9TELE
FPRFSDGPPARYRLTPWNKDEGSDVFNFRKFTFGKKDPNKPNKTILLVGATGSGKSTLINVMLNFVMGVQFEDKKWFEIVDDSANVSQADSQTSKVTVYEIFGFEGRTAPFSLTIIDTPGYGDTRGIEYDDMLNQSLLDLFRSDEGVQQLDAVGLVLKASVNRLDDRLVYIFDSVTSLFGKDIKKNIVALVTFSDGMPPVDALKALKTAKIKQAKDEKKQRIYFLFNNRQTTPMEKKTERLLQTAWETSMDGLEGLKDFLQKSERPKLRTTLEVLTERIRLGACIQNLKERIDFIELKQNMIKTTREALRKHEQEMKTNEKFTVEVEEVYKEKEKIKRWWDSKAICCKTCEENCHYPGCTLALNPAMCKVMKKGKCTSCSGKCPVEDHVKEKWKYVTKTRKVQDTDKGKKEKYDKNKAETEKKMSLLKDLEKKMEELTSTKDKWLVEAYHHVLQLQKIALNVDSLSTYVHLDFLIQRMEEKGDTEKVQKLEEMKSRPDTRTKEAAWYVRNRTKSTDKPSKF